MSQPRVRLHDDVGTRVREVAQASRAPVALIAVSAKSTSMKPVRQFLNKYYIGKLRGKNLPLFCYAVKLKLYQPTGTYAVLQPEIGPTFGREEIETWHRLSQELWNSRRIDLTQTPPEEVETPSSHGEKDDDAPF